MIINLIPAFTLISAVGWLGESLTETRIAGAALIAVSVAIFSWTELRPEPMLIGAPLSLGFDPADHALPSAERSL